MRLDEAGQLIDHDGANSERGVTLVEILTTLAMVGLLVGFAVSSSLERSRDDLVRGAAISVRQLLAQARIIAMERNLASRFAIDTSSGQMQVIDTRGTSTTTDDIVLASEMLPSTVSPLMPDNSTPVTLTSGGGTVYYADFSSTGAVSGSGQVALTCQGMFARATVFAGGGLRVERWAAGNWVED